MSPRAPSGHHRSASDARRWQAPTYQRRKQHADGARHSPLMWGTDCNDRTIHVFRSSGTDRTVRATRSSQNRYQRPSSGAPALRRPPVVGETTTTSKAPCPSSPRSKHRDNQNRGVAKLTQHCGGVQTRDRCKIPGLPGLRLRAGQPRARRRLATLVSGCARRAASRAMQDRFARALTTRFRQSARRNENIRPRPPSAQVNALSYSRSPPNWLPRRARQLTAT